MEDLIQFRPIEPEDLEVLRGYINDESVMVSSGAPYRQVSSHQQQQWWEALQKDKELLPKVVD
tara:strand:- start:1389 stop:1577 length:189 start_codon:yes stop_codon:yes gene_type:complete